MHLNSEFEEFRRGVEAGVQCLSDGGKLGIITWKHTECAILVDLFRKHEAAREEFPLYGWLWENHRAEVPALAVLPILISEQMRRKCRLTNCQRSHATGWRSR